MQGTNAGQDAQCAACAAPCLLCDRRDRLRSRLKRPVISGLESHRWYHRWCRAGGCRRSDPWDGRAGAGKTHRPGQLSRKPRMRVTLSILAVWQAAPTCVQHFRAAACRAECSATSRAGRARALAQPQPCITRIEPSAAVGPPRQLLRGAPLGVQRWRSSLNCAGCAWHAAMNPAHMAQGVFPGLFALQRMYEGGLRLAWTPQLSGPRCACTHTIEGMGRWASAGHCGVGASQGAPCVHVNSVCHRQGSPCASASADGCSWLLSA